MSADSIVAYIDGGARGNPGPAGYGVRIEQPEGTLIEEFGDAIGIATNNVAEYRALIAALEWARAHGYRRVQIRSDSLLLVQQMLGRYKVKHPGLQPLHAKAQLLAHEIGRVTFEHVGRSHNAHADRLANAAMDAAVVSPQSPASSPRSSADARLSSARAMADKPASSAQPADVFSAAERAVRLFIYRHFAETTHAPEVVAIAAAVNVTEQEVWSALVRLAEMRAIVLAPASVRVWMAHPFSAVPTAYPVDAGGRRYWANCAWDAAGVLSLLGGDGETATRCADCGEKITMAVREGRASGDGVVHYAVPPRRFWDNVAYT